VVGVATEHDLLVLQGNNPAALLRGVKRASSGLELKRIRERAEHLLEQYIQREVSIAYISSILTALNDALTRRAIELASESMHKDGFPTPKAGFSWIALGSAGREEQLLRTDQDNALVFEHVEADGLEQTRAYYLDFARRVTNLLAEAGFEPCPADMMASNPSWCLSVREWKRQFRNWILEPDPKAIMWCTIFFDFRPIYGNPGLVEELRQYILEIVEGEKIFLSFLAKNALEIPPPLTFFRNILVERSGDHKNEFDIKGRAMMPLADAARVLALQHKTVGIENTFKRFEALARTEPQNRELFEQAAAAYEILMRFRTLQGLRQRDSGRFFKPENLSKMDRILLRNCFQPIHELQTLLRTRFQLGFF
jgi:CBS domain-containing protein